MDERSQLLKQSAVSIDPLTQQSSTTADRRPHCDGPEDGLKQLSLERAEKGAEFESVFSAELPRYPRLRFIPERGASVANTPALLCEISRGYALICAFFEHKQPHLLHHANVAADRRAIEFKEVAELRQSNLTLLFQD